MAPQLLATLDARSMASLDEGRSFTDLSNGMYILQVEKPRKPYSELPAETPQHFQARLRRLGGSVLPASLLEPSAWLRL